ncbi:MULTISPECIES: tyrosine-type recombinase/integrase [unclassified Frankia]|uniref:tyrosine-type recombinase/integrase n=1 Tax=unclassified Frankia TaxID=2632575 RepID=UPI001EF49DB4|nr:MULTISPECIES: tyrosine-type recombinase/integrase [unclassified Frankia]
MTTTTYDVRIWKTEIYRGSRVTTYYVRWSVDGKSFREAFRNRAQEESFRADLVAATRKGEAFYVATGRPISMDRMDVSMSWYEFACSYTDAKWSRSAATTRRTLAEALTAITLCLLSTERGMPDGRVLRTALRRRAFNTALRDSEDISDEMRDALRWVASHTRPVSSLADPSTLRKVLDGLTVKLDGTPRAASVVTRWRKILNNAVAYAMEGKLLAVNPIPALKWKAPRGVQVVDRRSVVNPVQARTLLRAVPGLRENGPRLEAYFGCLYLAALRPEEASALKEKDLALPGRGWGELHLGRATPHAGKEWTNTGDDRDDRQLKQREPGEVRHVPCPPELTAMLHRHLRLFGTGPGGRLFVTEAADPISSLTVTRIWSRARAATFTPEVAASVLGKTPYDLRHAAVSTWLNAGVPATLVAGWAGHSVEVLLKIYAKCLDGEETRMRGRIEEALGWKSDDGGGGAGTA